MTRDQLSRSEIVNLHQEYTRVLPEYMYFGTKEHYDRDESKKYIGWKIHLNVAPNNVVPVSEFLKNGGYTHKFINQSSIEDGKIFTVYFGSKALTEREIPEIWDNLNGFLEEPKTQAELLVAPKIVARFEAYYHPVLIAGSCVKGVPMIRYYDEDDLERSLEISTKYIQGEFGDYFGGGIEYYDPGK